MTKYYIKFDGDDWGEVSKEEFISAEGAAGFRSKFGPGCLATAGLGHGVSGKITE